jgi:hypothetical protein
MARGWLFGWLWLFRILGGVGIREGADKREAGRPRLLEVRRQPVSAFERYGVRLEARKVREEVFDTLFGLCSELLKHEWRWARGGAGGWRILVSLSNSLLLRTTAHCPRHLLTTVTSDSAAPRGIHTLHTPSSAPRAPRPRDCQNCTLQICFWDQP